MNAKNRQEIEEQLSAYLDDELDAQARAQVEALLAGDESLRQFLDELRRTAELVQALPAETAPRALRDSTIALAERELLLGEPEAATRRTARPRAAVWRRLSAAAVIGVAALAGYVTLERINRVDEQRVAGTRPQEGDEHLAAPPPPPPPPPVGGAAPEALMRDEALGKDSYARGGAEAEQADGARLRGRERTLLDMQERESAAEEEMQVASRDGAERGALNAMRLLFPAAAPAEGDDGEMLFRMKEEAPGVASAAPAEASAPATTARVTLVVGESDSPLEAVNAVERFLAQNGMAKLGETADGPPDARARADVPALGEVLSKAPPMPDGNERAGGRGALALEAGASTHEIRFRGSRSQVAALFETLSIAHQSGAVTMAVGDEQVGGWSQVAQYVRQIEPAGADAAAQSAQRLYAYGEREASSLPAPTTESGAVVEPDPARVARRAARAAPPAKEGAADDLRLGLASPPAAVASEPSGPSVAGRDAAPGLTPPSATAPDADEVAPSPYVNELLRLLGTAEVPASEPLIEVTMTIRAPAPATRPAADSRPAVTDGPS